jgi:signal transduction histidine kinase
MLGTLTDVTERARAEADLRRAQRLEALGRLGGGVAHELNNALTSIIGFGDLLERSLPTQDDRREYTAPLLRSAWHCARLVRELLTFSRREPVVRRVVQLLQPLLGERITVVTELAPSAAPVLADEGQLEQVILSLALNARDAMADGGTLTIETLPGTISGDRIPERHPGVVPKAGEYVGLVLTDTGCGMSPHTIEHLFEPFYTTKGIGEGTGLGLAAAYGALRQNEGYIYVTSETGQGSSFSIYLPLATSDD